MPGPAGTIIVSRKDDENAGDEIGAGMGGDDLWLPDGPLIGDPLLGGRFWNGCPGLPGGRFWNPMGGRLSLRTWYAMGGRLSLCTRLRVCKSIHRLCVCVCVCARARVFVCVCVLFQTPCLS